MNKEEFHIINFALVWTIFLTNILVWLVGNESCFKITIIVEIFLIPFLYLLWYIIEKIN